MDPWSRVNYSLITPEAIMAMKSPQEMNPLSGCRRRSRESPEMGFAAAASLCFHVRTESGSNEVYHPKAGPVRDCEKNLTRSSSEAETMPNCAKYRLTCSIELVPSDPLNFVKTASCSGNYSVPAIPPAVAVLPAVTWVIQLLQSGTYVHTYPCGISLGGSYRNWYEEGASIARGGEEQLDKKLDVKLDMELAMKLDMKKSHGRAREEREACARAEDEVQTGARPGQTKNKDAADVMTWREYEALRNEMRREFRTQDEELKGTVQEVAQKLDATNETVNKMQDQMTDIQRSIQALTLAIDNLIQQQQQEDEDVELQDEARGAGRGVGRGNRGRGFVELGARRVPPQPQDDGLGKPKFSIPKFEGGADVEEYLTWELKIEKLWRLHDYTEDRKVKLASSEFDGYALC
ncbi:hypothetical protein QYE76_045726 [Lolium multiflorum]|uniref:Uncharacterized protein n=1 Tax=Lolium multiflorum TaxID=4521 RepID=A0AAD8TNJ8_LOLMU|nr:hypothetical protein QYE76_045726 [Lolium multiflorum]